MGRPAARPSSPSPLQQRRPRTRGTRHARPPPPLPGRGRRGVGSRAGLPLAVAGYQHRRLARARRGRLVGPAAVGAPAQPRPGLVRPPSPHSVGRPRTELRRSTTTPGPAQTARMHAVDRGGGALEAAVAEVWTSWTADWPCWTGTGTDLLTGPLPPHAAVVGLWD